MARVSMAKAAVVMARSRVTISNWRKRPGAPFGRDGSVDISELKKWARSKNLWREDESIGQPQWQGPADVPLGELSAEDKEAVEALVSGDATALVNLASKVSPRLLNRLAAMGKTRAQLADADKKDLENKSRRGELVEIAAARGFWTGQIAMVKQHFQMLPGKLAPRLSGKPYDEVYQALEEELRAVLEAFAREMP